MIDYRTNGMSLAEAKRLSHIEAITHEIALHGAELAALVHERAKCENQWLATLQDAIRVPKGRVEVNSYGRAISEDAPGLREVMRLRLYVAGRAPNSMRALANLNAICREYLHDDCKVEIIDALEEPLRALKDGVLVTPMLLRLSPPPISSVIGDLSQTETVLLTLGLETEVR